MRTRKVIHDQLRHSKGVVQGPTNFLQLQPRSQCSSLLTYKEEKSTGNEIAATGPCVPVDVFTASWFSRAL